MACVSSHRCHFLFRLKRFISLEEIEIFLDKNKITAFICLIIMEFLRQTCNIRIYHRCEGEIEKSVLRITDWHHEACRVMTNVDLEGWIFLFHTINGFFFHAHQSPFNTAFLYSKISSQKFRNRLRHDIT